MILQISSDRGATWAALRQIFSPGTGQWDAQIVVDPIDGRTVYASWLQDSKSDTAVANIQPNGFSFPFGDYYEMSIDDQGMTHAIWGEGQSAVEMPLLHRLALGLRQHGGQGEWSSTLGLSTR
jgi:hypothetical protein